MRNSKNGYSPGVNHSSQDTVQREKQSTTFSRNFVIGHDMTPGSTKLFRFNRLFKQLWSRDREYSKVLEVCFPLMLSLSAITVMEFTDRVFLANYSVEAISAALPAGITSYLFIAFFGGVGGYAGVFIAQYTGRGDHGKIGSVLWQAIYFSIAAGILLWLIGHFATEPFFRQVGHAPEVRRLEEIYFSILAKGSVLHLGMVTLATFFSGRGLTRPVLLVTVLGVLVNIPLDYALIFGHWGFPELGIKGAAIATVSSWGINVACFLAMIFRPGNEKHFNVCSSFYFDSKLFSRLLRYGIPGALQFTLDILAFTFFILLVGRIGTIELAATNIVISINSLAFMPSSGVSQGMSILVGQALGRQRPSLGAEYVYSGSILLLGYILVIDSLFIFAPDLVLSLFSVSSQPGPEQQAISELAGTLLKIVAAYLCFDALYMVLSGALRGAGDTRFMMLAIGCAAPLSLVLPIYIGITWYMMSATVAWLFVLLFVIILFLLSAWRFKQGKWKTMLVIEKQDSQ